MRKIAFVGAGSTVFAKTLIGDVLTFPELADCTIALHDTVEAAITGRREHVYHAAMLDPHTAAELDLDQIHALVDDMLEAHGELVSLGRSTSHGSGSSGNHPHHSPSPP